MSEYDEYLPTVNMDNTAPPPICARCGERCGTVYFIHRLTGDLGETVCGNCDE